MKTSNRKSSFIGPTVLKAAFAVLLSGVGFFFAAESARAQAPYFRAPRALSSQQLRSYYSNGRQYYVAPPQTNPPQGNYYAPQGSQYYTSPGRNYYTPQGRQYYTSPGRNYYTPQGRQYYTR